MDEKLPTSEVALADAAENRPLQAYRLKMAGRSLAEIADELGYNSPQAVHGAIKSQLNRDISMVGSEERESILQLQNDRYEYLLSKVWPQVEFGDLAAIREARALVGDIAKLHKLDAIDTATQTTQVLVIGGAEADYVANLKKMVE